MATWKEAIVANIRAERARTQMRQEDLVLAMQALGFTNWCRQTVGVIERGGRRVTADEIIGLARIFGVPVSVLLDVMPK